MIAQERMQRVSRISIVVDDQNLRIGFRGPIGSHHGTRGGQRRVGAGCGQADHELAARTEATAESGYGSAVSLDDRSDNGQAEPQPALAAVGRPLALYEEIEHPRQQGGRYSSARVSIRAPRRSGLPSRRTRIAPPGSVYFTAFVSRFVTAWTRRRSSPTMTSDGGWMSTSR